MLSVQEELLRLRNECRYLRQRVATLERAHLAQKQKSDRLEELLKERDKFIKELEREKDALEKSIGELKRQREVYKGMVYKPNRKEEKRNIPNKRTVGGQTGHTGKARNLPETINKEFYVFANHCPHCNTPLTRTKATTTHIVEDIPEPQTVKTVTSKYVAERQWCSTCQKEITAIPYGVIPKSRLGINLIIQILIWKYVCRLPFATIVQLFKTTYDLDISEGGIAKVLSRTRIWFGPSYAEILKRIRASPIKHADETGWRIKGVNSWLWAFLTKNEAYYTIEETRGKGVPNKILGDCQPTDVLIRDDYKGYEKLPFNHQSCWAHLLRKSHEAAEQSQVSEEVRILHNKLKEMFGELSKIVSLPFKMMERELAYGYFSNEIKSIIKNRYSANDAVKIQTRIKKQKNNLLTALLYEDVPLTNNLAERMIRPMVVTRKISGGSRSDNGAQIHAVNMSIIQTINLRNQPLIPTLQSYILKAVFGER